MTGAVEIVSQYLDAWNTHDAAALVELFADYGTYQDPNGIFIGDDIGNYAQELWDAFPDLTFQLLSPKLVDTSPIAMQWRMTGTNIGGFNGLPPTGRSVSLDGADFISVKDGKIVSVVGYFDSSQIPKQLGLQILVQPDQLGPFSFGYSVSGQGPNQGARKKPGAFSITTIWNADEHAEEMKQRTRDVANELLKVDGVLGIVLTRIGGRGITFTAWEHVDDIARAITHSSAHGEAMRRFWDEMGEAAYTSVWVPERVNTLYVRCTECRSMADYHRGEGNCACGESLPEPPDYF